MDNLRWRNISLSVLATTATWPCPRYVNDYHELVLSYDIAKGGLTDDHVLILPIGHQASQVKNSLFLFFFFSQFHPQMDLTEEGEAEVAKFKSALRKMYKRQARLVLSFPNQLPF